MNFFYQLNENDEVKMFNDDRVIAIMENRNDQHDFNNIFKSKLKGSKTFEMNDKNKKFRILYRNGKAYYSINTFQ